MGSVLGMVEQFGGDVEAVTGEAVGREVMIGAERLTAKSKPADVALWLHGAIDRLDTLAPADAATVMERCGTACSGVNHSVVDRAKARRAKFASEEAFLDAEARKPATGTRIELEDDAFYQVYTPAAYSHPMRCYCGLMRGLPADVVVSPTYCNCSKAFVRAFWTEALGRPVEVEMLGTAISGSTECRFRITPRHG